MSTTNHPFPRSRVESAGLPELSLSETLLVIPCSGGKRKDGKTRPEGPSIVNSLPGDLARELRDRRAENAREIEFDTSGFLPAIERYNGYLYKAAGKCAFNAIARAHGNLVIISGGYGLVLPNEPITSYDRKFKPGMWPGKLVGRCVAAYAERVNAKVVVGVCCVSPPYGYVLEGKNISWPETTERVFMLSPDEAVDNRTAKVRALGEALKAISRDERITADWTSSDGVPMQATREK